MCVQSILDLQGFHLQLLGGDVRCSSWHVPGTLLFCEVSGSGVALSRPGMLVVLAAHPDSHHLDADGPKSGGVHA